MTPRSLRSASILAGIVFAAVALIGWSQSWYTVTLTGLLDGHPPLEVGGDVSAPAVAALALAAAAGYAAISISGPFFRVLLAILEVALGASIAFSAILAIADPSSTVAGSVTEASGLAGAGAVTPLIESIAATAWPYVTLIAGSLLIVLGIAIVITGRRWPAAGRRYEPVQFEAVDAEGESSSDAAVSHWDELSGGSDPTSH